MPQPALLSYAVDAEDVVLHRALGWVTPGTYLEIAPVDPEEQSPTRALAELGWTGVLVAPGAARRPGEVAVAGLADAGAHLGGDLHVAVVPGWSAARDLVAAGLPRPWVLVVRLGEELDSPGEVPGYARRLVVGRSALLVDDAHDARLGEALSRPADSRDRFERATEVALRADLEDAARSIQRWRAAALAGWPGDDSEPEPVHDQTVAQLAHELAAVKATLSWRLTRPLRLVSSIAPVRRLRARR